MCLALFLLVAVPNSLALLRENLSHLCDKSPTRHYFKKKHGKVQQFFGPTEQSSGKMYRTMYCNNTDSNHCLYLVLTIEIRLELCDNYGHKRLGQSVLYTLS